MQWPVEIIPLPCVAGLDMGSTCQNQPEPALLPASPAAGEAAWLPTAIFPARLGYPNGTTASGRHCALSLLLLNGYQEAQLLAAPGGALSLGSGCISLPSNPSSMAHSCRTGNKVGTCCAGLTGESYRVHFVFLSCNKQKEIVQRV